MIESEIGYRGSKSNKLQYLFVKEQRVDGSCCKVIVYNLGYILQLRCTLIK